MRAPALALLVAAGGDPAAAAGDMALTLLTPSTELGGYCLDGSPAGYYVRAGTDSSLFVLYMKGGGSCNTQADCRQRAKLDLGTSKNWATSMTGGGLLSESCAQNPDFCEATAVFVAYCTGDGHRGTRTTPTNASWPFIFDGHLNFMAIVKDLKAKHGLSAAKNVMLTGGSAGARGTLFNVDFLAEQLPGASVKGAPESGWFFPDALPNDPTGAAGAYWPSSYPHFANGTHGNIVSDSGIAAYEDIHDTLYGTRAALHPDCVAAQKPGEWWACLSIHTVYRYIKAPLYIIENQYDANQILKNMGVPGGGAIPAGATPAEVDMLERYIAMYGEAMRNSTAQILNDAPVTKKAQADGLFSPSCLMHAIPHGTVQGQKWIPIAGDWFFGRGKMEQYYRLVESCPASAKGLPCNSYAAPGGCGSGPMRQCCVLSSSPAPGPAPGPPSPPATKCKPQMMDAGCLTLPQAQCIECGAKKATGCSSAQVKYLCTHSTNSTNE